LLSDLFINSVILIAVLSVGTQVFREKPLTGVKTIPSQMLTGGLLGLLGCVLMVYSVHIDTKVILDFRNIPIILAAVSTGTIASIAASIIIGLFRIFYLGVSHSSTVGFFIALSIGVGCGLICKFNLDKKIKWTCCVIYALIAATVGFMLNITDNSILTKVLCYYWATSILISIFIYYYMEYLYESGYLYRRYRDEVKKDFLTGLNNVRQFDNVFNEIILQVKAEKRRMLSLLYIDIDFFKKINDTYGHKEGDAVLKELSIILSKACWGIDLVFRNGGEEFSIILPNYSSQSSLEVAERIRTEVQEHEFTLSDGRKINITISIGVSTYPETVMDIDRLLEEADNALYVAKRTGRNKVVLAGKRKGI
jgi:diguanylate cyclase